MPQEKKGELYVVATPIGNLEDCTYRAIRVLREADLIACEDTRQTQKLLDHYDIKKPAISYHEHNEQQLAIEHGIRVVPVPGASAVIAALAASGLPTDAFEFHGFLAAKPGQRRTMLESLRGAAHTVVFYEAPHRIKETMRDIVEVLGAAVPVVIARELTKIHEEFIRGRADELLKIAEDRELKGEITLLIGKTEAQPGTHTEDLESRLKAIMQEQQLDEKSALKLLAKEQGRSKSELYRELQRVQARGRK